MQPGLEAEGLIMRLLIKHGVDVKWSTPEEDMFLKVDLWFPVENGWVGVQLSIDKEDTLKKKGPMVIRRGIVPMWIDWDKLQTAVEENDGSGLVKEFCTRIKKILNAFPNIKRFSGSEWDLRMQMK